jgi:hypothetical protein
MMAEFLAITFDTDQAERPSAVRALQSGGRSVSRTPPSSARMPTAGHHPQRGASTGTETGRRRRGRSRRAPVRDLSVAGIVGGAVTGGLVGGAAAPGLDGKFVKEVGDDPSGGSALFLQIKGGGNPGLLVGAMRQYHGRVRQTSLPDEVETALDESLR